MSKPIFESTDDMETQPMQAQDVVACQKVFQAAVPQTPPANTPMDVDTDSADTKRAKYQNRTIWISDETLPSTGKAPAAPGLAVKHADKATASSASSQPGAQPTEPASVPAEKELVTQPTPAPAEPHTPTADIDLEETPFLAADAPRKASPASPLPETQPDDTCDVETQEFEGDGYGPAVAPQVARSRCFPFFGAEKSLVISCQ